MPSRPLTVLGSVDRERLEQTSVLAIWDNRGTIRPTICHFCAPDTLVRKKHARKYQYMTPWWPEDLLGANELSAGRLWTVGPRRTLDICPLRVNLRVPLRSRGLIVTHRSRSGASWFLCAISQCAIEYTSRIPRALASNRLQPENRGPLPAKQPNGCIQPSGKRLFLADAAMA